MSSDLYDASFINSEEELKHLPLAARMRPRDVLEIAGQKHLLTPGSPVMRLLSGKTDEKALPGSVILWGPAGSGKTTIAQLIATKSGRRFVQLSAVDAGVANIRQVVEGARIALAGHGEETILFIDEIHRFSKSQQDVLLPSVENRTIILVAATTENPAFSLVTPLLSRSMVLHFEPLTEDDIITLLKRAVKSKRGLNNSVKLPAIVAKQIVKLSRGDVRKALTILESAASGTAAKGEDKISLDTLKEVSDNSTVIYDSAGDEHYDVASAFIKSMRGSDVDAALHYLARMLQAGEDPRFIARRVMIAASEEVGMADPSALQTAVSASLAVERIGMPEARIILAQAVVYVTLAPKSNATYLAIDAAIADVAAGMGGQVPAALRDAHYKSAKDFGVEGYKYAHDFENHVVAQQYLPDDLQKVDNGKGQEYYHPSSHGNEANISSRLEKIRDILRG